VEKPNVMPIFGTRPEAIKMAPVVKELKKHDNLDATVTVTAQHREMLDQVLALFEIKPDHDLDLMQDSQSLTEVTAGVLKELRKIYQQEKPDIVLVHGDTSTTFAASLAAYYQQIEIGHVEAGLRTGDKYSPFPEEMNRHLTGVVADLHFAPTETNEHNLMNENVKEEDICVTGNTVIDALLDTVEEDYEFNNPELHKIDFASNKVILLTAHRRENFGQPMQNIFNSIKDILAANNEAEVVYPVHLNPEVKNAAEKILKDHSRVHLIEPLDYEPFVNLMNRSHLIMTDSGGIQEEAPSLGKPVLVLRDTTERPEAIKAGTVKKVGTEREEVFRAADELLNAQAEYDKMAGRSNPYGDGEASQRILQALESYLDLRTEKYSYKSLR